MLNKRIYEGKSREELFEKMQEELNLSLEELYIEEEVMPGSLFKGQRYRLKVVTKEDVRSFIEAYVREFSTLANIKIEYALTEEDDFYKLELNSENNPILIGREGKTLTYFQILLRQALLKNVGQVIHINVDIANYKEQKLKNLESQIEGIAKEVLSSKIDAILDPMSSYERRKVHTIISTMDHLKTESVGEGNERHIVIHYVEK